MLSEEKKQEIINALTNRTSQFECPICHTKSFILVDGYFTESIQDDYDSLVIGSGNMIPSIAIVCSHCGFISRHAIGVLGLMKPEKDTP